jgi:EmrB/QacA subfamily drug resistance transporter
MLLIDDTIVNVGLPTIGREMDLSETELSWVVNAYFLTFGGFLLIGGRAADLLGRRRMLSFSLFAFAAASLVAGLAPNGEVLVASRAVQGLAGALLSPAALAILLATFRDGPERTKALGVWAALAGVGAATGLLAGGAIIEALDWRWIFFVNVPIGLAALALVPRLIPADEPRTARRTSPDIAGAVLGTSGLLLLVYTVVETESYGWGATRTIVGLAGFAVLLVLFVLRERTAREPLVPGKLVARRHVAVANSVMAIGAIGMFAMFFFLTLYMQIAQGYSPLETGAAFLPFSFSIAITSGIVTKAMAKVDVRALIVPGLLIAALGLWLMRGLEPGDSYWGELAPLLALTAAGLGLVFVPILETATGGADEEDSGLASALLTTSQQVGAAIGIAILVTIASSRTDDLVAEGTNRVEALTDGFSAAFGVGSLIVAGAAVVAAFMGPLPKAAKEPVAAAA